MQDKRLNMETMDTPVEKTRMRTLRDVVDKTISSFTNNLKLIKPLSNCSSDVLKCLQKETISQLQDNIKCELEQMYTEENIECLLNTLDTLVDKNVQNKDSQAWRPSGNVQQDIRPVVEVMKRDKLKVLENTLSDLEAQNKLLMDKMKKREHHLLQTRDKILANVEDIQQCVQDEEGYQIELQLPVDQHVLADNQR